MSAPAISVVTVCRNPGKELPEAAAAVLAALGAADEWVVQDGASTDGTADFLRGLAAARVQVERRPDGGIYDAMNRAAARAQGDYLLFLGRTTAWACAWTRRAGS